MVISVGHLKSYAYSHVVEDISAVVRASQPYLVKVILETALLSESEKIAGSFLAAEAGAHFVKTCTGFNGGQAEVKDVQLMKNTVAYMNGKVKVKASAGIRSFDRCVELLKAGADRIGTSSGVAIMEAQATPAGEY
jgi:deoxyribose-phosphate aldolase